MMKRHAVRFVSVLMAIVALGGCRTTRPSADAAAEHDPDGPLARAQRLYDQGLYTKAMHACIDAAQLDPNMPGLTELQQSVGEALWEQRAYKAAVKQSLLNRKMQVDTDLQKHVPDSYRLRRGIIGETASLRSRPSAMERALERPVTIHLDGVTLPEFILAVGADENINIISDDLDNTKTMTLHADNVPLREVLDYVSRNLEVTFSVGRNMIWATPQETTDTGLPMETRVYRLRKGLSSDEIEGGPESIAIIEAIERFIPETDGADLFFSEKAHTLIVKNTRTNLARIEELIEALDVSPPQVLIEARFISSGVTDLQELGIDWVLNSSLGVTETEVVRNGGVATENETEISSGSLGFTSFANESTGLNFTYQGVLTDPMFEAVVHALETSGQSRTLSVPKVTTVNNRPASIRIGEDFRYFEEYDVEEIPDRVSDEGSTTYRTVLVPVGRPQLEELGIELNVTPSVGADLASVSLHLIPEISTFVRYEEYNTTGGSTGSSNNNNSTTNVLSLVRVPIFNRSRIETEVVVRSGETVVMGGLIESSETQDEERIPVLSAIPILGRLFRHDTSSVTEKNLLIFVTATILSERGEDLVPIAADSPGGADVRRE